MDINPAATARSASPCSRDRSDGSISSCGLQEDLALGLVPDRAHFHPVELGGVGDAVRGIEEAGEG